jgi:hypothetical protein
LKSLEIFLKKPYLPNGITLGGGTQPTYNPTTGTTTPPPTTTFDQGTLDGITDALPPDDHADPGTVTGLALTAGINSIFAKWDASPEADVKDGWGQYRVQLDNSSNTFPSPEVDKVVGGTFTSFTGLTTGTTYYVRVAAIDAYGNQSAAWSSVVSTAPIQVTGPDIAANSITSAHIVANTIVAGDIAADTITGNELAAVAVEVGKHIQSDNYDGTDVATGDATVGWRAEGSGNAEFQNVRIRGDIVAETFSTQAAGDTAWVRAGSAPGGGGDSSSIYWHAGSVPVANVWGVAGGGISLDTTNSSGTSVGARLQLTNDDILMEADADIQLSADNDVRLQSGSSADVVLTAGDDLIMDATSGGVAITSGGDDIFITSSDDVWVEAADVLDLTGVTSSALRATGGPVTIEGTNVGTETGGTRRSLVPMFNRTSNAISGSPPAASSTSTQWYMQSGYTQVSFSAGNGTLSFPSSFPSGLLSVVVSHGLGTDGPYTIFSTGSGSASSVPMYAYQGNGAGAVTGNRWVNWVAYGW